MVHYGVTHTVVPQLWTGQRWDESSTQWSSTHRMRVVSGWYGCPVFGLSLFIHYMSRPACTQWWLGSVYPYHVFQWNLDFLRVMVSGIRANSSINRVTPPALRLLRLWGGNISIACLTFLMVLYLVHDCVPCFMMVMRSLYAPVVNWADMILLHDGHIQIGCVWVGDIWLSCFWPLLFSHYMSWPACTQWSSGSVWTHNVSLKDFRRLQEKGCLD